MITLNSVIHWFIQYPLAAATILYEVGVFGVLAYAYFEPRDQR